MDDEQQPDRRPYDAEIDESEAAEPLSEFPEPLRTLLMLDAASQVIPGLPVPPALPPWLSGNH